MLTEKAYSDATPAPSQNGKAPDDGIKTPMTGFRMIPGRRNFFGLLDVVKEIEPGVSECAERYNYVGPSSRLLIRLSIIFGGRRRSDGDYDPVYIDGKKCSFDWHRGLTGPGIEVTQLAKTR